MRKKIKNEIKEMVANSDWANIAPDNDNYYAMAYLYPMEVNNTNNNEEIGIPKAVLTCRPDSHPFPKRTLLLNQPVKVGRAVGKIKAAPDNAIFDCKVLSRHHASLWFSNGKFYLQDTKSSNGTFVNNHRLSEGTKESAPFEVCSRDVVQFGVDVLENSNKITHGCIVATLNLYMPDGKEAIGSPKPASNVEDLCVLNNILQEAFQREHLLEAKLHSLRQLVMSCGFALNETWRALCSEERLVARVQYLERKLEAVSSASAQQQPTELQQLLDDKHQYEVNAREALQVAHQEKLKLLNQLGSIQWSMCSSEEECSVLKEHVDRAHQDLHDLGEKKSVIEGDLRESKKALLSAEKLIEKMVVIFKEGKGENGYSNDDDTESKTTFKNDVPLPEALEDLPKHVKALLPEQLIEKIGADPLKVPYHIKQLETKLSMLKEELFKLESINSVDNANDNTSGQSNIQVVDDQTLENKENSEYLNSTENSDSEKSYIDVEGNGYIMTNDNSENLESVKNFINFLFRPLLAVFPINSENFASNIANQMESETNTMDELLEALTGVGLSLLKNPTDGSNAFFHLVHIIAQLLDDTLFGDKLGAEATKEMKIKLIKDKINELTDQISNQQVNTWYSEEGSVHVMSFLQMELSKVETKISNISKELETVNDNLAISNSKVNQLTLANNQLTCENEELKQFFSHKAEECRKLELMVSHATPDEGEKSDKDEEETTKYKTKVTELQHKLDEVLQSEATGSEEIEKLNDIITGLQRDLQGRPLSSDVEEQSRLLEKLKENLKIKEKHIEDLNRQLAVLAEMQVCLEDKINKMSWGYSLVSTHVQTNSRDVADKVIMTEHRPTSDANEIRGPIVISSSLAAADLLENHSSEDLSNTSLSVDLRRLTELEEELVITKEQCARINEDRTEMSVQLKSVKEEYNQLLNRSKLDMLVYILPLVAILVYLLMYQYIS